MKHIAESTVRRLSLYLSFLEEIEGRRQTTISSDELARLGGTTSAQVRKDLSFFGSFGKRGLGYSVNELRVSIRDILGLGHKWRVCIIGAGKIGTALAGYEAFSKRGFHVMAIYDSDADKVGMAVDSLSVRDIGRIEQDAAKEGFDIAVLAIPPEFAQGVADRVTRTGIKAILNFAPTQLAVSADVTVRTVNMALELEGLSFALTNRNGE